MMLDISKGCSIDDANLQIIGYVVSRVNVVFHVWADKLASFLREIEKEIVNHEILYKDIVQTSKRY